MGAFNSATAAYHREKSVDAAWIDLCEELEAVAVAVARRFAETEQAHLSYSEVHDLAQLVDLAEDGQPLDGRLVDFAAQCLMQVVERAVRTRFRPKYFSEYRCLNTLWRASARRSRELVPTPHEPRPAA